MNLPTNLPTYLPIVCPSIYPSIHPSFLSTYLSFCPSIYPSIHPSIHPFIHISNYLTTCISIQPIIKIYNENRSCNTSSLSHSSVATANELQTVLPHIYIRIRQHLMHGEIIQHLKTDLPSSNIKYKIWQFEDKTLSKSHIHEKPHTCIVINRT